MQAALSHYRVLEQIGSGGMGVVYRAHDERLERDVALKVLPPGALEDEAARKRFRKEALALSKLNHPNIATIFDFDTQDSTDFLVEELIPGLALSEMLASGPLPEREILNLGAQLAEGLAAAHEHGVVHRDLKPANVRVTPDARVKVLDFGLAKMVHRAGPLEATASLTETQAVSGTLPYMAPEQLLDENLDARTDLWACGCVLYEMATGRRPFLGSGPALTDAILHQPPAAPSKLNHKIAAGLEAIILKCLEKDPTLRYASARDIAIDLHRLSMATGAAPIAPPRRRFLARKVLLGVAVLLVVVLGAIAVWVARRQGDSAAEPIRSLAVLPLANLSGDPQQEYFADGMTEELITELSKIGALKVTSRTSVLRYKGTQKPLPEIARELKVDALVEGSVLRSGDRVRITAQLIRAATDQHLWAESYDRDLRDVLALHSEVARAIAQRIRVTVTPAEQARLAAARPVIPEAHEAYLRGRYFAAKFEREPLLKARDYLQQAIDKDPTYAPAYAELSHVCIKLSGATTTARTAGVLSQARAAAEKAMELDPTLAQAHTVLGLVSVAADWNLPKGFQELERGVELAPDSADALIHASWARIFQGRTQEARAATEHALEVEPLNLEISALSGQVFAILRDYDRAIQQLHQTLEIDPAFPRAYAALARVYAAKGMYAEAVRAHQKWMSLTGATPQQIAALGDAFARGGERGYWMWQLDELNKAAGQGADEPGERASLYAVLGEKEKAFACLEKAYQERDNSLFFVLFGYRFDSIRSDSRFQGLLRRLQEPRPSATDPAPRR